jgi:predicted component of type VI protein secretion system
VPSVTAFSDLCEPPQEEQIKLKDIKVKNIDRFNFKNRVY